MKLWLRRPVCHQMNKLDGRSGRRQTSLWQMSRALHLQRRFQGSRNKPKGAQGPGAQGQKQLTDLEDVVVMMAWELLTMKQRVGTLRCGANFVVILRDKNWKQQLAEVCEGWCAKQQEKGEGAAHTWACSKRGAAFGCVISLLNKAGMADSPSAPRNTEVHPGWTKVGFVGNGKNVSQPFGTAYSGPLNQVIPNTKRTCHGPGWLPFAWMRRHNLWTNSEPCQRYTQME